MNDPIQQALMKHIERAVRPLRAGRRRKLQIREELLAHLSAIYRDEVDQRHDEAAALAAAKERFGDSAELSAQLAATISWRDRWEWRNEAWIVALDRTLSWREGERFSRFALRSGAVVAGAIVVFCLTTIGLVWLAGDWMDPMFASFNRYTALLFSCMAANLCAFWWAIQTTWRAIYSTSDRRKRWAVAWQLAGWTLVFTLIAAGFWLGLTQSLVASLQRLPRIAFFATATTPAMLLVFAWMTQRGIADYRPHKVWQRLEIEE